MVSKTKGAAIMIQLIDKIWQPMETAPKDGTTIEVCFDDNGEETCLASWSERPVCMLGSRCGGFPPGWATTIESNTDSNLPLFEVIKWRPVS